MVGPVQQVIVEGQRRGHRARRLNSICSCRGSHQSCGMREGAMSRSSSSLATNSDEPWHSPALAAVSNRAPSNPVTPIGHATL